MLFPPASVTSALFTPTAEVPLARTHTPRGESGRVACPRPTPLTRHTRVQHPGGARPTLPSALPPPPTSPLTHTHVHTTHAHIRRQLGTENPRRAFWRHKCNVGPWLHLCTCFLWVWRSVAPVAVSGFDGADVVSDNDRILRLNYCYHRYRTTGRCAITLIVIAIIVIIVAAGFIMDITVIPLSISLWY